MKWKNALERHIVMAVPLLQKQLDRTIMFLDMGGQYENIEDIFHIEELIDKELNIISTLATEFLSNIDNRTEIFSILTLLQLAIKIEESSDIILSNIRMFRELSSIPDYAASLLRQMLEILKETYGDLIPLSAQFKLKPEQRDRIIDIQYRQITRELEERDLPRSCLISLGRISRQIEIIGDAAKDTIRLKQKYLDALEKLNRE